jgi:UDP-N-acetylmuramoyl-tripeptide--D-alanyl-D-alanine ligase
MIAAMRAARSGTLRAGSSRASRSTPARLRRWRSLFAIKGDNRDGHGLSYKLRSQAGAGLRWSPPTGATLADDAPLLVVPTCSTACAILRARRARARRRRSSASPARSARPAPRRRCGSRSAGRRDHASVASYNNHWGVPLSLARCPQSARYAVFEIGMNHAGEIEPLTRLVRPHVAIITTIEPVHLEFFGSLDAIADAKAEIFCGSSRAARR